MGKLFVWCFTAFAAFGGFLFGYDIGVINGVKDMEGFRMTFNLSDVSNGSCAGATGDEKEGAILGLVVSMFSIGCFFGALLAGGLSDAIGRKLAIVTGGVVFTFAGVIQSVSYFIWMMFIGRIVAGIGVGILSMVVPIYNAELAPKSLRGRLVSLNQLSITAGIMVSFVIDLIFETFLDGWRVALALQCVFGITLIVGMLFLPESPRWLVVKNREQKAVEVLAKIRHGSDEDIQEEVHEIALTVHKHEKGSLAQTLRKFLHWRILQRIALGMILQLFQQFTGMNVIMYYSTSIFCTIGVEGYVSTAVVGMLNFLTTILSVFLVDKFGRKVLLLLGALGMTVSMAIGASLLLGFHVEEGGNQAVGYVVVLCICLFVFNFAYGWGPTAWVVTSEIYPLNVRGFAVSLTTSANWIGNFIVAMCTPVMLASSALQTQGTFYILAVTNFLAFLFVLLCLPETKGESLERVDTLFSKPWVEMTNIWFYLRCGCPWGSRWPWTSTSAALSLPEDGDPSQQELDEDERYLNREDVPLQPKERRIHTPVENTLSSNHTQPDSS